MINEFYCDQCQGYMLVDIQHDIDGLHVVKCGECKHLHYRIIKGGVITDLRFSEKVEVKFNKICYEGKMLPHRMETASPLSESWMQTVGVQC